MSITKQCSKCKRVLDRSKFSKDRRNNDGLTYRCKECQSEYHKEKNAILKWETMMAFGGRCNHIDNGVQCDKNVFTDLSELDLSHPHDNGNEHRNLISNRKRGRPFYKALKDRDWNTDGYIVEIMCRSHHRSFDINGKKHHRYGKRGKSNPAYKQGKFNNPTWLKNKYETKTIKEIADECGVSYTLIRNRLIEFGPIKKDMKSIKRGIMK